MPDPYTILTILVATAKITAPDTPDSIPGDPSLLPSLWFPTKPDPANDHLLALSVAAWVVLCFPIPFLSAW